MAHPESQPDAHFLALYEGKVVANEDPRALGRVKVRVPGLYERGSPWARPIGAPGAGAGIGFFFVPRVGSNVSIFCKGGDTDHPRFLCGPWGMPGGNTEVPTFALFDPQDGTTPVSAKDRPGIAGIQTEHWQIIMDNRKGKESLILRQRDALAFSSAGGSAQIVRNEIEIDGANQGIRIQAIAGLTIDALGSIDINAPNVRINGRRVAPRAGDI